MKKYFLSIFNIIILIIIFLKYNIIKQNILNACLLFIKNIFPSLFPMFIISSILLNTNSINYINILFHKITKKIFKINKNTSFILLISIFSGFPSNAKISKEMYDKNLVSKDEIKKIILFSHFSNPLFILSMIINRPLLVLTTHYITNFIIGFFSRNLYIVNMDNKDNLKKDNSILNVFFDSIKSSINTLLFILGTIVTFYIISSIINIPFFNIILELSQGLNYISLLNISLKLKTILLGGLISFGGICIHFQVFGILSELKIKYSPYLISRIIHSILTMLLIYILY